MRHLSQLHQLRFFKISYVSKAWNDIVHKDIQVRPKKAKLQGPFLGLHVTPVELIFRIYAFIVFVYDTTHDP